MSISRVLLVSGSANFSTRDVWDGYRIGLEMCGITVIPYPTFSFIKVLSADSVCSDIIGTALDVTNKIDCVIFVDGLYFRGKRARVPLSLKRAGLPTVLITTDDPYETLRHVPTLYTYCFTNEVCCSDRDRQYLPTATMPVPSFPLVESPKYDVSFLGTVFADRLPLLLAVARYCEERERSFLIAGKVIGGAGPFAKYAFTDVRQRTIDTPEKWEIYAQSKVSINQFRTTESEAQSPNPRVFEVTAFGHAALLSGPNREEVDQIFGDSIYTFDEIPTAIRNLDRALRDERRLERVQKAQQITLAEHTYEHRAADLVTTLRAKESLRSTSGSADHKVAWIIGCGRTGSTWLAEMLGELPDIRHWHEPYFGRFFRHVQERPQDLDRATSFFAKNHQPVWLQSMRDMFFNMVRDRYPRIGQHALVVKEVNTPELYAWLGALFPTSPVIFLKRDPFDILDSYLDLQKPGSWNAAFGDKEDPLGQANVRRTAEHIKEALQQAMDAIALLPEEQSLTIAYEDLLRDPAGFLEDCAMMLDCSVDPEQLAAVIQKHDFQNYKEKGALKFRRQGKAGTWMASQNFVPHVQEIAEEVLGPLRRRLGYTQSQVGT